MNFKLMEGLCNPQRMFVAGSFCGGEILIHMIEEDNRLPSYQQTYSFETFYSLFGINGDEFNEAWLILEDKGLVTVDTPEDTDNVYLVRLNREAVSIAVEKALGIYVDSKQRILDALKNMGIDPESPKLFANFLRDEADLTTKQFNKAIDELINENVIEKGFQGDYVWYALKVNNQEVE